MTIPTWRLKLAQVGGRGFAIFMATVDAIFSFAGSRDLGYGFLESLIVSGFIFIVQYAVGVAIASRVNLGEKMNEAFFDQEGAWGTVAFIAGSFFIVFIVGVYAYDIYTNFAAFIDGSQLQDAGLVGTVKIMWGNIWTVFWSAAISLGDEFTNVLIDFLSGDEVAMTTAYLNSSEGMADAVYRRELHAARIKAARKAAKEAGRRATF